MAYQKYKQKKKQDMRDDSYEEPKLPGLSYNNDQV